MLHDILIILHATGGSFAFIAGLILLVLMVRQRNNIWLFRFFLGSLALMIVPLIAVIGVDWPELDVTARVIFSGLGVLALYMGWRAIQASRAIQGQMEKWPLSFADHTGFNMISLFDGFIIIMVIDLGGPIWLVIILAVLAVVFGIWSINKVKSRVKF